MRLTGRIRLSITTAAVAVVVAAATTFAGQGEPPGPSAGSSGPASGGKDPVIHVPAVHAGQARVGESKGTPRFPTSALARLDIPPTALLAYQRSAAVMAQADRSCHLSWTLLAAIGRVESDHGRYAGAVLQTDGVSSPLIRGVQLDGRGSVARVVDTDGGVLDGDKRWDRAVGPMQFLPSTWSLVAVDGDGDGIRSPDDIDDAAMAAGVFLCSGPDDLGTTAGRSAAVFRYNPSHAYVASVLAVEHAYRTGDYTLQGQAPEVGPVHVVVNGRPVGPAPQPGSSPGGGASARADGPLAGPTGGAPGQSGESGHPDAGAPGGGSPDDPGTPAGPDSSSPSHHASTDGPTGSTTKDGHGTPGPANPTSAPLEHPTGSGHPSDPGGTTDPSTPGAPGPTEPGPTDPAPTEPDPTEPDPSSPGPTSPAPDPTPDLVTLTGVLARCGPDQATYCLEDTPLDAGDPAYLATPAIADLDADGIVESNADELDGLVGTPVSVQVLPDTSPALVVTVNDLPYRTEP